MMSMSQGSKCLLILALAKLDLVVGSLDFFKLSIFWVKSCDIAGPTFVTDAWGFEEGDLRAN